MWFFISQVRQKYTLNVTRFVNKSLIWDWLPQKGLWILTFSLVAKLLNIQGDMSLERLTNDFIRVTQNCKVMMMLAMLAVLMVLAGLFKILEFEEFGNTDIINIYFYLRFNIKDFSVILDCIYFLISYSRTVHLRVQSYMMLDVYMIFFSFVNYSDTLTT